MHLGPFELEGPIGQGAMGEVWRARHLQTDTPAAIKVITAEHAHDDKYRRRFNNEVRSVAGLNHPGIIRVYDYGEVSEQTAADSALRFRKGSPYLAMEMADRGCLLDFEGEFDWQMFRDILVGLLEALGHAHAREIIHRDLKPSNVLITRDVDGALRFKITDFGLAFDPEHDAPDSKASGDQAAGTPYYMAPEQFRSRWRDFGPWTDLYALGCMAWRLATGDFPFTGEALLQVAQRHLAESLPDFEPRFPVPDAFEHWLARLLEKHPNDRFRTAADALWSLVQMPDQLDGEPTTLAMDSTPTVTRADVAASLESLAETEGSLAAETLDGPTGTESFAPSHMDPSPSSIDPIERRRPPIPDSWVRDAAGTRSVNLAGAGLELFNLRDFPVVGRHRERDRLGEALRTVDESGSGRVVLLKGAAGVGKTRLARWLRERAEELGASRGMVAVHSPTREPHGGLSSMIADYLDIEGLGRDDARDRVERWYRARGVDANYEWRALTTFAAGDTTAHERRTDASAELGRASTAADGADESTGRPSQPSTASDFEFSSTDELRALLSRFLGRATAERPLVVHLDDLQWGQGSLHFLEYLVDSGQIDDLPVLFVGTVREEALPERPLEARQLDVLTDRDCVETLEIASLDATDQRFLVEELLYLAPNAAHQILDRAAGNPLFAIELVRDWIARDLLDVTDRGFALRQEAEARMPEDLYEVWSDRLERLVDDATDDERAALEIAAALGIEIDETEWRRTCASADLTFPARLVDRLLRQNLLADTKTGWQFAHSMLRESLEQTARDANRWASLNRACAETLERHADRGRELDERIADHYLAADEPGRALGPLLEAVERRGRRGEADRAANLLELAERAFEVSAIDADSPTHAKLVLHKGRVALSKSFELEEAERQFQRVLEATDDREFTTLRADALLGLTRIAEHRNQFERAVDFAERALEVLDDDQLGERGRTHHFLARSLRNDSPEAALPHFERADELLADVSPDYQVKNLQQWGTTYRLADQIEEARAKIEQAFESARRHHQYSQLTFCANELAELARSEQRLERAEEWYERAEEFVRLTAEPTQNVVFLGRVQTALERRAYQLAADRLDRAESVVDGRTDKLFDAMAAAARIHALAGLERWHQLTDLVDDLLEQARAYRGIISDIAETLERATELAVRADRRQLGRQIGEAAADLWAPIDEQRSTAIREDLDSTASGGDSSPQTAS